MTNFKPSFKTPDTSRRGPNDYDRNTSIKQFIDVFGKHTQNGEFLAVSKPTTQVSFGIDRKGWPYARITGNRSGWQLNGKQVDSEVVYLDISCVSRGDLLTNVSLDAKYSFQTKGKNGAQYFYVCWSPLKGDNLGVNPLVYP